MQSSFLTVDCTTKVQSDMYIFLNHVLDKNQVKVSKQSYSETSRVVLHQIGLNTLWPERATLYIPPVICGRTLPYKEV